jgi:hypothetical protein
MKSLTAITVTVLLLLAGNAAVSAYPPGPSHGGGGGGGPARPVGPAPVVRPGNQPNTNPTPQTRWVWIRTRRNYSSQNTNSDWDDDDEEADGEMAGVIFGLMCAGFMVLVVALAIGVALFIIWKRRQVPGADKRPRKKKPLPDVVVSDTWSEKRANYR